MNTSNLNRLVRSNMHLLRRLNKKLKSIGLLRFGGQLIDEDDARGVSIDSYYTGGSTDINDWTKVGYWTFDGDFLNTPGDWSGTVNVIHSNGNIIQMAISRENGLMAKRVKSEGVWSEWDQYVPVSRLPKRRVQKGTLPANETIIELIDFTLDASDVDSFAIFVDGVYMMDPIICDQTGTEIIDGVGSYIKLSEAKEVALPYKLISVSGKSLRG